MYQDFALVQCVRLLRWCVWLSNGYNQNHWLYIYPYVWCILPWKYRFLWLLWIFISIVVFRMDYCWRSSLEEFLKFLFCISLVFKIQFLNLEILNLRHFLFINFILSIFHIKFFPLNFILGLSCGWGWG